MSENIIQNLTTVDHFADIPGEDGSKTGQSLIHIRVQQRNGRKVITTVQGISQDYDLKKIAKAFKKKFHSNGTVIEHPEYGEVIQLQGDNRTKVKDFLVEMQLAHVDSVKVHGF